MAVHRIRYQGPAAIAVSVATAIADADGIELTASQPPAIVGPGVVALEVAVEAEPDDVDAAVAGIRDRLPEGASLEVTPG